MDTQVGIFGRGRLGTLVADAVCVAPDLELAWTLGREEEPSAPVDVAVDVSAGAAVAAHLAWARQTGTDLVIGATGYDPALLLDGDPSIGVLVAPNFSLSVALLRRLCLTLGRYAGRLAGSGDVETDLAVLDVHHRGKVDSPSGTARLLAGALAQGSGRPAESVQAVSLRLGAAVGRHEVRLDTPLETLTLTHEAHDRAVYAQGALTALRWVHGRAGIHTLDDLAADILDPLLAS